MTRSMPRFVRHGLPAAAALTLLHGVAAAQLLDDFSEPAAGWLRAATGAPGTPAALARVCEDELLTPPGSARDVRLNVYGNPLNSVSAVGVGNGRLTVSQGTGATAETVISYGAFTRVDCDDTRGGPRLGWNLSTARSLRLVFSGAEDALNLNVTYYTAAPLNPAAPLYYASAGINVRPTASGGPLEVRLPAGHDPAFNWRQVDGVVVLINRSGPTPHTSYTLQRLVFSNEP